MQPTYQILSDYSHLFPAAENRDLVREKIFETGKVLPGTLDMIRKAYQLGVSQTKNLADHLRDPDFVQSCFNIYHFVTSNIRYTKDTPGQEEIRLPARSYADRFTGVDCEDYAILIGGLLTNMGFEPRFEVVGFLPRPIYGHIFCVAYHDGQSIPIDTTPYMDGLGPVVPFATRPKSITHTMEIRLLAGLAPETENYTPNSARRIMGLAGVSMVTPLTQMAMDEQTEAIGRFQNNLMNEETPKRFRKARLQVMLNGLPEAAVFHGVADLVDDINEIGQLVLIAGVDPDDLGEIAGVYSGWAQIGFRPDARMIDIEGIDGLEFDKSHPEYNELILEGIGSFIKRAKNKIKSTAKKATNTVKKVAKITTSTVQKAAKATGQGIKKAAQATGKGVVKFVKNPLYYINKVNPATIVIRNAVLAVLRLNLFKISSRLKYAYLTEDQVKAKGWSLTEHKKLVRTIRTLEEIFNKVGGEKVNLKNAIVKGGGGIGSLGEPATVASTAAATPIIVKIVQALKAIDFVSFFNKKGTPGQNAETSLSLDEEGRAVELLKSTLLSPEEEAAQTKELEEAARAPKVDPSTFNRPEEAEKAFELSRQNLQSGSGPEETGNRSSTADNNTFLWITGIAVVAVGIAVAFK